MPNRNILFVSKGESASSTRYRALQYFALLQRNGWQPQHLTDDRSLSGRRRILQAARRARLVVVLRRPFANPFRSLLGRAARELVFDFDDAIFLKSSGERDRHRGERFRRMLQRCDQVWAGNPYLAAAAAAWNPRVSVVPTSVETARYEVAPEKPDSSIDLVWIGSGSTRKHLITVLPALELAARQVPRLRLKIVADFILHGTVLQTVAVSWSEQAEALELASSHIGIAPLPDNPFTRGKCGLKVLQYMAAGLPVITSPTGVNGHLVQHGTSGLTARTAEQWISAVQQLSASADLRLTMGERGRERCRKHYSLATTGRLMLSLLPPAAL